MAKTFDCRFGCGHTEGAANKLTAHYKTSHASAYAKYKTKKAAARAERDAANGGGLPNRTATPRRRSCSRSTRSSRPRAKRAWTMRHAAAS